MEAEVNVSKETQTEFIKGVLASADALIHWTFILNGAAAAGLLTFLGNAIDNQDRFHSWTLFGPALVTFCIGLILSLSATFTKMVTLNYVAQSEEPGPSASQQDIAIFLFVGDRAVIFGLATFILFVASALCFITGAIIGKNAVFG